MAKAFLSHSSKDKDLVRRVANVLGNKNCVIDEISFEAGRQTLTEIFRELATSDIFVLFISNNSLQSEWVIKEIEHAGFNLTEDIIDRILPIVIDPSITYDDPRIPKWISKPYNLKYTKNEALIVKKIKQSLREVCLKNNKFNRDLEKNFVGRNAEMEHFENDINNLDGWTPTYIVAYNYFEGIGRRTFLKNALRKANYIEPYYEPVIITIDGKESLENFIYKLNTVNPDASIMEHDLSTKSMEEKVNIAKALVKEFINFREIIFIIDDGGIVLPHHEIVGWFRDLVQDEIFANNLVFCLVSRYKPNEKTLHKEHLFLSLQDSGTVQIGNAEPVFEVVAYTPNGQHSTQRQGIFPKQARRNTLANQFGCFHDGNRLDERTPEHQRHCGVFGFLLQHFARTSKIKPFGLPNHVIACPQ